MKTIDSLIEELAERDEQLGQMLAENARLREALRLHMAHFEWKCTGGAYEVLNESYARWNYLAGLTEQALGLEPQKRWRL